MSGAEKPDRVIAPIVREPTIVQMLIPNKLMNRQQFDGGHAKVFEVVQNDGRRHAQVGAAQGLRHIGMTSGQSFDMHFIDDRLIPWSTKKLVGSPRKGGIDDDAFGDVCRTVPIIERKISLLIADLIAEHASFGPMHGAGHGFRVGIDEQFIGIEAMALGRIVGAMDTIAVMLAG